MRNKEYKIALAIMILVSVLLVIISFAINVFAGVISLAMAIALVSIFVVYQSKRLKQIEALNDYLSLVCSGDYSLDIDDNEEGELSILKNNLYKVVVMLRSSNEALQNDKVFLADSIADISHQLKTPMTSVMMMNDIIRNEDNPAKRNEFVSIVDSQLERMKWLILTLLKISKLDANVVDFSTDNIGASSLVDEAVKPFALTTELKGVSIHNRCDDYVLTLDKNWTCEALQNIIKNCIEHTDNGEIIISSADTNTYYEISISDSGTGISAGDLPHIFERFYHGKNSSSESVGIGLALSKQILTKQNATIDVTSTEGIGTTFTIKFYKSII